MDKNKLLKKVKELGYPLLETEEPIDANSTLAEVVKSRDHRLNFCERGNYVHHTYTLVYRIINSIQSYIILCYNYCDSLLPAGESSYQLVPINPPFADISRHSLLLN